ncbi:hypothetical protein AHOG_25520 [Actinoalloteichus hoggarensis]|uniref:Uncharacterized protein n=2 Tax=Actinoalloteichus hoggarensis TaxID=1470176 RepID=A0A221WB23_9PSEU|nr:hypothetical protein AHOG_25520 [Actinoalloteichus hoggarensis]
MIPEAARLERARALVTSVLNSLVFGCLTVIALTVLILATAGDDALSLGAVASLSVPAWLAAHQVPLVILGEPLGVLPLLPTLILFFLIATSVASTLRRLGGTPWTALLLVALTGAGHGVLAVAFAEIATGGSEGLVIVFPSSAGVTAALLAATAAGVGVLRCGMPLTWSGRLPAFLRDGVRVGLLGAALLLAVGASVTLFGLLVAAPEIVESFTRDRLADALGLLACSLAYLPNAVVAGLSFAAGSGFSLGHAVATPFASRPGPELDLPLLAALPDAAARPWWALTLLLPIAAGLLLGGFRAGARSRRERLRDVLVGVGLAASIVSIAAAVAGGRLGSGAFDPVHVPATGLATAVLVLVGTPAVLVALLGGPRRAAGEGAVAERAAHREFDEDAETGEIEVVRDSGEAAVDGEAAAGEGDAGEGDAVPAGTDPDGDAPVACDAEDPRPVAARPAVEAANAGRRGGTSSADPDGVVPDGVVPDGVVPDDVVPDDVVPDGADADGARADAHRTDGARSDDGGSTAPQPSVETSRTRPAAGGDGVIERIEVVEDAAAHRLTDRPVALHVPAPRRNPAVDSGTEPGARSAGRGPAATWDHLTVRSADVGGVVLPSPVAEAAAMPQPRGTLDEAVEDWPQEDPDAPRA